MRRLLDAPPLLLLYTIHLSGSSTSAFILPKIRFRLDTIPTHLFYTFGPSPPAWFRCAVYMPVNGMRARISEGWIGGSNCSMYLYEDYVKSLLLRKGCTWAFSVSRRTFTLCTYTFIFSPPLLHSPPPPSPRPFCRSSVLNSSHTHPPLSHNLIRLCVNMYTIKAICETPLVTFVHLVSSTLYERRFGPYFIEPVVAGLKPTPMPGAAEAAAASVTEGGEGSGV
jgi:hypothetical protein